jgi:hypothetical protein
VLGHEWIAIDFEMIFNDDIVLGESNLNSSLNINLDCASPFVLI